MSADAPARGPARQRNWEGTVVSYPNEVAHPRTVDDLVAIMKDPATYEHVSPETIGNRRKVLVSEQAGKSNVLAELERVGIKADKDDPRIGRLLEIVKEREAIGYAYEAADASFELLARRTLGKVPNYLDVTQFDVNVEQRNNAKGERVTDDSFFLMFNAHWEDLVFTLPRAQWGRRWQVVVDTRDWLAPENETYEARASVPVEARSLKVLRSVR